MKADPTPATTQAPENSWHDRADRTKCQAASQRSDGECWWDYCPVKDGGTCPLQRENCNDD